LLHSPAHETRSESSPRKVKGGGVHGDGACAARPLRIAIIGSSRFPIAEPFAGGLEAHVWSLTRALKARGHHVSLFAAPGSDPVLGATHLSLQTITLSESARRDVSFAPGLSIDEHHAYLALMMALVRGPDSEGGGFDIVHNHSLHYLPIAMAPLLSAPLVTTLHTPPTPWLESAMQVGSIGLSRFVAVSSHTADAWRHTTGPISVIHNGIDLERWKAGPGGGPLVWSGRLVPEKGPHAAMLAARLAGRALNVCGPIIDRSYFERELAPLLDERIRYLGHLDHSQLSEVVRTASAALVTPGWDEPYGLVVAEALASGTPVAAFARGGIPEILDHTSGRLVAPDDVAALAAAIPETEQLSRIAARRRAELCCSAERMVDSYERLFRATVAA
jgi:glycosyltransferase involved in cell wall biosynthesis